MKTINKLMLIALLAMPAISNAAPPAKTEHHLQDLEESQNFLLCQRDSQRRKEARRFGIQQAQQQRHSKIIKASLLATGTVAVILGYIFRAKLSSLFAK